MKTQKEEARIQWIDFAKFLGILFVLLSHMELGIPYVSDFGYLFYVPIFFILAGYTYQQKEESLWNFIRRKGKRLLMPYFGYSLFLYLFFFVKDNLLQGTISSQSWRPLLGILYARNSLYPPNEAENINFMTILNSPMWFLPALFLASVLFEICIRLSKNNWKRLLVNNVLILAIGIWVIYMTPILLPWSLDTVCLFEVFVSTGYIMKSKMDSILSGEKKQQIEKGYQKTGNRNCRYIITCVILFATSALLYKLNGSMNVSVGDFGKTVFIGEISGIVSSYAIILLCYLLRDHIPEGAVLIGRSSLTIMCLHMFIYMFIKTGINILNPELLLQDTVESVFAKSMAVCATLAILTIFDLYRTRKSRTSL